MSVAHQADVTTKKLEISNKLAESCTKMPHFIIPKASSSLKISQTIIEISKTDKIVQPMYITIKTLRKSGTWLSKIGNFCNLLVAKGLIYIALTVLS